MGFGTDCYVTSWICMFTYVNTFWNLPALFLVIFLHFIKNWNMTWLLDKMACRICARCKNEIGHGEFTTCMGADWHPECFCCHACNRPISDREVKIIWVNWKSSLDSDNKMLGSLPNFLSILVVRCVLHV